MPVLGVGSGHVYTEATLRRQLLPFRAPMGRTVHCLVGAAGLLMRAIPEKDVTTKPAVNHGQSIPSLPLSLERDIFLRTLIRELTGTLQDVVGLDEASGFISVVGQRIGDQVNEDYKAALAIPKLSREQVSEVLVDLKRRIQGDFYVIEEDEDKIVLGNRACPFGEKVVGRPALCMMTSNVFGVVAAENLGYGRVVLEETIAEGAQGCRIVVHLKPPAEGDDQSGREYFKG